MRRNQRVLETPLTIKDDLYFVWRDGRTVVAKEETIVTNKN